MTTATRATHTKGPWRVEVSPNDDPYIVGNVDVYVCRVESWRDEPRHAYRAPKEASAANARLIAAAPAMLQALRDLVQHRCVGAGCYNNAHKQAQEAIAQAEGQS